MEKKDEHPMGRKKERRLKMMEIMYLYAGKKKQKVWEKEICEKVGRMEWNMGKDGEER